MLDLVLEFVHDQGNTMIMEREERGEMKMKWKIAQEKENVSHFINSFHFPR